MVDGDANARESRDQQKASRYLYGRSIFGKAAAGECSARQKGHHADCGNQNGM
jgi:hypothetical protein